MLVVASWLNEFLDKSLTAERMAAAMDKAGIEVEGLSKNGKDSVIDIKTAPNRVDLQSYAGLAREVAAHTGTKTTFNSAPPLFRAEAISLFENKVKQLVPRYSLVKLKLKKAIGPSPAWLQKRLDQSGIRPINVVVDVTNYVMLAYGQPLHAFDGDKVRGKMVLRLAQAGEQLRTLDGVMRLLEPGDLVIADDTGVIDILGIMGGLSSQIDSKTNSVYLTAPTVNGIHVRKTSTRLGLRSEASARFERGLPIEFNPIGSAAASQLLDELVGTTVEQREDELNIKPSQPVIKATAQRMSRLAGVTISDSQVVSNLRKLQFKAEQAQVVIKVSPPYWRPDVSLEEDVFEEVIKLIGLDKVPSMVPPYRVDKPKADTLRPRLWQLQDLLAGLGANEVTTYPFVSATQLAQLGFESGSHLQLKNPRSPEQSHLRLTLLTGLLNVLERNRLYKDSFSIFEMGNIFGPVPKQQLPQEQLHLGVMLKDDKQAYQLAKNLLDNIMDLMHIDLKLEPTKAGVALRPGVQAKLHLGSKHIGMIGELHPALLQQLKVKSAAYWEVGLEPLLKAWQIPKASFLSKYETVKRDLTVWLDRGIGWQTLRPVLRQTGLEVSYGGEYYDTAQPRQRALTLHLEIGSHLGNLTEAEADQKQQALEKLLADKFGAKLKK